jgi:uncharacterized protein DUF4340
MRFRNTLVLASIFLAFAAYLWFVERPSHEAEESAKKLLTFKTDQVSSVTLTYGDSQIVIQKTAAGWQMQKPIDVLADQSAVDNLLHAAADAEVKRTIDKPQPLETYGLDKPETVLTIALVDGKTLPSVRIGKAAPVGFSAYAQLEGSTDVKLVPSIFQSGMKREVKDLRDKKVIDFKDDEVQSIEIAGGPSTISVERDGADWKITKPTTLKADPVEVRTLLSSIKGVRAEDFVDEPSALADYGLATPRRKITLAIGKDATKELWIGAEKAKGNKNVLYVKRPDAPTVYAVGTWAWTSLDKDATALRDKTVVAFDPTSLGAIEVERREGGPYRLVKEAPAAPAKEPSPAAGEAASEPGWKVDGAKRSKSTAIAAFAGDLHSLKGYEVAADKPSDLTPFGLAQPDLTISLIDVSGKPIGRLLASQLGSGGAEGGEAKVYAMAEGGGVVYRVRGYLFSHLDKKKADFVEAEAAPATPAAAPAASGPPAGVVQEGNE